MADEKNGIEGNPAPPPKPPKQTILIRLRWRLPLIILLLVILLLVLSIVFYTLLLVHFLNHKNDGDSGVSWRIITVIVFMGVQVVVTGMFFLSFYLVVTSSPGEVPLVPWRRQPWYINRETFIGEMPLNKIESIEAYHNDPQNPNMVLVNTTAIPSSGMPLPDLEEEEEGRLKNNGVLEDLDMYEIPDNYSPIYDDWRRAQRQQRLLQPQDSRRSGSSSHNSPGRGIVQSDELLEVDLYDADDRPPSSLPSGYSLNPFSPCKGTPSPSKSDRPGSRKCKSGVQRKPQKQQRPVCSFSHLNETLVNPFYVTTKDKEEYRYCFFCHTYKPDIAYHCKVCGTCVYNFDHHCPYVDRCIGRNNYRTFMSFLVYATLATLIGFIMILITIVVIDNQRKAVERWSWIILAVLALVIAIFMGRFLIKHIILIYQGRTTMEKHIYNRRVKIAKEEDSSIPEDPYDLLTKEERKRKGEIHREILFGPPSCWRWIAVLNPFPRRTDQRPTELAPVIASAQKK